MESFAIENASEDRVERFLDERYGPRRTLVACRSRKLSSGLSKKFNVREADIRGDANTKARQCHRLHRPVLFERLAERRGRRTTGLVGLCSYNR